MHFHTRILCITTVVALVCILAPFWMWRGKTHDYHLLERSIITQLNADIADAQPKVELQCETTADMEYYDSGGECHRLKTLLAHAKPDKRSEYVSEQLDRVWFQELQEWELDHWYRITVLTSSFGICLELVVVLYFWAVSDTMEIRQTTLPSKQKSA